MLRSTVLLFFGKHASCYVLLFSCTSVSTLHATFITAKTVRKLKRWKRIAGAVASRGICHMFISWRCLLAPAFHGDLWKKTLFYCSGSLKMHVELHKSPWKEGAKRHRHDINTWQIAMFSPRRTSPWTWKLMKTLVRFPGHSGCIWS